MDGQNGLIFEFFFISAHHRKSAVELLEASKAEYVKSTHVLNNKQELKHPENLSVSSRLV